MTKPCRVVYVATLYLFPICSAIPPHYGRDAERPIASWYRRRYYPGMTRTDKTLDRMRANPRDWRIDDLESVARAFGVNIRKPGGSHVIFEHPRVVEALSVPAHRPIKPIYVKMFVRLVDAVNEEEGSEDHD